MIDWQCTQFARKRTNKIQMKDHHTEYRMRIFLDDDHFHTAEHLTYRL